MLNVGVKIDGAAGAAGQVNADDFNAGTQESINAVTRSGQTLSGANSEQIAEAMAINGGAITSFVDGGTANTIELTPTTGSAGLKIPTTYTLMRGFRVIFFAAASNTGNVTLNIGQTAGTLLGSKKLLQSNGDEIPSGSIIISRQIEAIYDSTADSGTGAWVLDEAVTSKVLTGTVIAWPTSSVPAGFLACNGASVSRTTYSGLFNVIGVEYGNVDANTFNLPDYRGEFLRGWDNGAGNDPDSSSRTNRGDGTTGDNPGTKQADQYREHFHDIPGKTATGGTATARDGGALPEGYNFPTSTEGGNETRPTNIYVNYIIKT